MRRMGQSVFWPPKNVTFFHSKLLLYNSASFTSTRMKDLYQKQKVGLRLTFSRRLHAGRNRDCYMFGDHWQSETVWWLDLNDPDLQILGQIYAIVCECDAWQVLRLTFWEVPAYNAGTYCAYSRKAEMTSVTGETSRESPNPALTALDVQ